MFEKVKNLNVIIGCFAGATALISAGYLISKGYYETLITEYEKTEKVLEKKIQEKDEEIARLKTDPSNSEPLLAELENLKEQQKSCSDQKNQLSQKLATANSTITGLDAEKSSLQRQIASLQASNSNSPGSCPGVAQIPSCTGIETPIATRNRNNYEITLRQCNYDGPTVTCHLNITNNGQEDTLQIVSHVSNIVDYSNNTFLGRTARIANSMERSQAAMRIIPGNTAPAHITFRGFTRDQARIAKLKIHLSARGQVWDEEFTRVPLCRA